MCTCLVASPSVGQENYLDLSEYNQQQLGMLSWYLRGDVPNVRLETTGNPFEDKRKKAEFEEDYRQSLAALFGTYNKDTMVVGYDGARALLLPITPGYLTSRVLCVPNLFKDGLNAGSLRLGIRHRVYCKNDLPNSRNTTILLFDNETIAEQFFLGTEGKSLTVDVRASGYYQDSSYNGFEIGSIVLYADGAKFGDLVYEGDDNWKWVGG